MFGYENIFCKRGFSVVWGNLGAVPALDVVHIQGMDDKFPDVAGIKEFQGGPDKDGDGITDLEDDLSG